MHLRHDFALILSKTLGEAQLSAISSDLESMKYNCAFRRNKEEHWVLLVGMSDQEVMLEAAEQEMVMCKWQSQDAKKREKNNKKLTEQKTYLDPRIVFAESRRPF